MSVSKQLQEDAKAGWKQLEAGSRVGMAGVQERPHAPLQQSAGEAPAPLPPQGLLKAL